jgi:hypothetical protein
LTRIFSVARLGAAVVTFPPRSLTAGNHFFLLMRISVWASRSYAVRLLIWVAALRSAPGGGPVRRRA